MHNTVSLRVSLVLALACLGVAGLGCPSATSAGGEGEGEGAAGEGEGAAGEGEGAAGEGEGAAGEGEGEGGGADEAGDESNPRAVTAPFSTTLNIDPEGDHDCFSVTTTDALSIIHAESTGCADNGGDTIIFVYDSDGNEVTEDDDGGDEFCSSVDAAVLAGTYVVCVQDLDDSNTIEGLGFDLSVSAATIVPDGSPCDTSSTTETCDLSTGSECLFDGTDDVCGIPSTLTTDAVCNPDSEIATCDFNANEACLTVTAPDDFHCVQATIVDSGGTCVAGTTAAVCADGLSCIDGTCQNADTARCANIVEFGGGSFFDGTLGATDAGDDTCGAGGNDLVIHYQVQASRARVTFAGLGVNAIALRAGVCDDPGDEITCRSSAGSNVVAPDVDGGTDLFLLVDGDSSGDDQVLITVSEEEITVLDDGAGCDPASTTELCGTQSTCSDPGDTGSATCNPQTNGGETCDVAVALPSASGAISGTLDGFTNDYHLGGTDDGCTGFSTAGHDAVYSIAVGAGQALDASMQPNGFDASLYVIDSCPFTDIGQCVDGSDAGSTEHVHAVNSGAATTYYVVVDAFGTDNGGDYSLSWSVQ